jgi:hypothetical protein
VQNLCYSASYAATTPKQCWLHPASRRHSNWRSAATHAANLNDASTNLSATDAAANILTAYASTNLSATDALADILTANATADLSATNSALSSAYGWADVSAADPTYATTTLRLADSALATAVPATLTIDGAATRSPSVS